MSADGLIPEQRHQALLRLLHREGVVTIRRLSADLGVSHMTVRRDIAALEESGLVTPVKGGVRLSSGPSGQYAPLVLGARTQLEVPRKKAIAELAAELIGDGSTLFLDAGTTCHALIPFLANRSGLTVVTNDFEAVRRLAEHPQLRCLHTGGTVDHLAGCSEGDIAAQMVSELNFDLYLVSTAGWSIARGVTAPSVEKAQLKRSIFASASRSVLLADSTKYGSAAAFRVAPLADLDVVVSDDGLDTATAAAIEELGIELRLAAPGKQ